VKRYVSAKRSAAGATAVTVSLVDGELSARWTVKTYIGCIDDAVATADAYAHRALDEIRAGLEPKIEAAS
jgi:hypothetical protein